MNLDHFKLAFQNLRHRKLRAWLTMLGIFIGIAAVVSLIGLGEGLRVAISGQFGNLGTDIISVQASGLAFAGPPGTGSADPLTKDLTDKIARVNGVETAINRYIETGTLEFNDKQGIGMAMSIPGGSDRKPFQKMLNFNIEYGRDLKDGDRFKLVLGSNFLKEKNGFDRPIAVGDSVLLNDKKFEVVGIYEKKGSFIFDNVVAVNEDILLDELRNDPGDDSVNVIAVKVKNEKEIPEVTEKIEKLLRKERKVKEGEENFEVSTPQQSIEQLNSVLGGINLFVFIIASVSLIIGGVGIMNTMYTAVLERTKEIGIMKSIGAKNSTIFTLFFIESGLLGMVGGLIGIVLGVTFSSPFFKALPFSTPTVKALSINLCFFGSRPIIKEYFFSSRNSISPAERYIPANSSTPLILLTKLISSSVK